MCKKISKFIGNMFSGSDDTSHKRVISVASFFVLISILVLDANGIKIADNIIFIFAGLCGFNTILTVIEKLIK